MGKAKRNIYKKARVVVLWGTASIAIGVVCMVSMRGHLPSSINSWLVNGGYSLMLGYGLFGNGYVYSLMEERYGWVNWLKHPLKSLLISFVGTTLYSTVVIFFTNWFWYVWVNGNSWSHFMQYGKTLLLVNYIALYIIAMFFYARGFLREMKRSIISEQQLKQEAIALQYKVLSNQVNPHFLFNSLNVLNSLIRIDQDRAQAFVGKLSDFYRNLLSFRGKDIISVAEELNFVVQYLSLQSERFGNNIYFNNKVPEMKGYQIIPMTLQMLVENAIKHNQISKENKLEISIYAQENYLVVENNFKPYINPVDGEKLGLKNLSERYSFLTDRAMEVEKTDGKFVVKVPLLKLEDNQL